MDGRAQAGMVPAKRMTRRSFLRRAGVGALLAGAMAQNSRSCLAQPLPSQVTDSPATIGSSLSGPGSQGAELPEQESGSNVIRIDLIDNRGVPPEINVPCKSTIAWINLGVDWTRIASLDGTFDSGRIAPGEAFEHQFERPGSHQYMCERQAIRGKEGRVNVV